jgi:hypothetical protein
VDLHAVNPPKIFYDLIEGDLEACVIRHVAPANANLHFSIVQTTS